jgi:hypothetical protein
MPLEDEIGNLCHRSIGRMPCDRNLLSLDGSLAIPTRVLCFKVFGLRRRTPSYRFPPVRPVRPTGQTGLELQHLRFRFCGLGFVDQTRNPEVFW